MNLAIVSLHHRLPTWVAEQSETYHQRFAREWPIKFIDLKPLGDHHTSVPKTLEKEAKKITASIPAQHLLCVLDEQGQSLSSVGFAHWIDHLQQQGQSICFVIGSADGLDPTLKNQADKRLSVSPMTLPHLMVRVILMEQIYRAYSLLQGHPYHRE